MIIIKFGVSTLIIPGFCEVDPSNSLTRKFGLAVWLVPMKVHHSLIDINSHWSKLKAKNKKSYTNLTAVLLFSIHVL